MGWGPGIGYVRPVQFLDHLTVIKIEVNQMLHQERRQAQTARSRIQESLLGSSLPHKHELSLFPGYFIVQALLSDHDMNEDGAF